MANEMEFANRTAAELLQLLARRVEEHQAPQTGQERFQALLAPIVLMLANVLQDAVTDSDDPRRTAQNLMDFTSRSVLAILGIEHKGA